MKRKLPLPSKEVIEEFFEVRDWVLYHKPRDEKYFTRHRQYLTWHKRFCGKRAGRVNAIGHMQVPIFGVYYFAHRIIYKLVNGDFDESLEIDHIDENKQNNNPSNLRLATEGQNHMNVKLRKDNRSGIKGVYFYPSTGKWMAQITSNKKKIKKYFITKEEAANWVAAKRKELHGEFANHGNGCVNGTTG